MSYDKYNDMPVVGRVQKGQPLPLTSVPLVKRSPYLEHIKKETLSLIDDELSHRNKFGSPKRNLTNVLKSIHKMDKRPSFEWELDPKFWKALALFRQYKKRAFSQPTLSHEEAMAKLVLAKVS